MQCNSSWAHLVVYLVDSARMSHGYAGPRGDGVEPHVPACMQCEVPLLEFEPILAGAIRHSDIRAY